MTPAPVFIRLDEKNTQVWESAFENAPEEAAGMLAKFAGVLTGTQAPVYISASGALATVPAFLSEKLTDLFTDIQKPRYFTNLDDYSIVQKIFSEQKDADFIYACDGIFPLLNAAAAEAMVQIQLRHRPDYSYSEIHPPGLTPVLYGRDLLEQWDINEYKDFPAGEKLSAFIEKNINKFHVEVRYESPDVRLLRLDFSCNSLRSFYDTKALVHENWQGANGSDAAITNVLEGLDNLFTQKPELLRLHPGYIELEFSSDCEYACTFCVRQFVTQKPTIMTAQVFEKINLGIKNLTVPVSVCAGGLGEPLQHEEAAGFLQKLLENPNIENVVLETNAYYLEKIFGLVDNPFINKLKLIINYNSNMQYNDLHAPGDAVDAQNKVLSGLRRYIELIAQKNKALAGNVYLQMLKITDNQNEVDEIFNLCDELGIEFLFQKYNSYAGQMPEKRVSDMTPLERFPCWHLRRDLVIRADGSVPYCRQDTNSKKLMGNILQSGIDGLWQANLEAWVHHYKADYSDFAACAGCDEYYTFSL